MKQTFLIVLNLISVLIFSSTNCNNGNNALFTLNNTTMANTKIKIKVGQQIFSATLSANNSAKAFKELLPLTINMIELNGNEKYHDLTNSLPSNSANPGTIKIGDLMLYGSKTLVLFYQTFSTSYSYTKLATVDDITGFAKALGSGNVSVIFE